MEITYHQEGDYLITNLIPPESPRTGIWGERRRQFLRKHRKPLYSGMLMSGTLNAHLEEVNREAEHLFNRLTEDMAKRAGITEALKAEDQMEWVRQSNSIRLTAEEIVRKEWIKN